MNCGCQRCFNDQKRNQCVPNIKANFQSIEVPDTLADVDRHDNYNRNVQEMYNAQPVMDENQCQDSASHPQVNVQQQHHLNLMQQQRQHQGINNDVMNRADPAHYDRYHTPTNFAKANFCQQNQQRRQGKKQYEPQRGRANNVANNRAPPFQYDLQQKISRPRANYQHQNVQHPSQIQQHHQRANNILDNISNPVQQENYGRQARHLNPRANVQQQNSKFGQQQKQQAPQRRYNVQAHPAQQDKMRRNWQEPEPGNMIPSSAYNQQNFRPDYQPNEQRQINYGHGSKRNGNSFVAKLFGKAESDEADQNWRPPTDFARQSREKRVMSCPNQLSNQRTFAGAVTHPQYPYYSDDDDRNSEGNAFVAAGYCRSCYRPGCRGGCRYPGCVIIQPVKHVRGGFGMYSTFDSVCGGAGEILCNPCGYRGMGYNQLYYGRRNFGYNRYHPHGYNRYGYGYGCECGCECGGCKSGYCCSASPHIPQSDPTKYQERHTFQFQPTQEMQTQNDDPREKRLQEFYQNHQGPTNEQYF